jgi:hypothetical protein
MAAYREDHPMGEHADEAALRIDELEWQAAARENAEAAYAGYLRRVPAGRHAPEAHDRIEALRWEKATASGTAQTLEAYLRAHPQGKYVRQAREGIDDLHWREAAAANTVVAYDKYLATHSAGRSAAEARKKIAALRSDDTPFLNADRSGTRGAYEGFLSQYPGHRREREARSRIADMEGRSLADLIAEKKVEAKIQGAGIESVTIALRRLVPRPVQVKIPVGTFFVSRNASAQSMVGTTNESLTLNQDEWTSVSVAAACANRTRDIPGESEDFTVQSAPNQKELERLMPVLGRAGVDYPVRQAAVWMVTDNADFADLGILVGGFGGFGPRIIQEAEAARAMQILDEAGIDISRKAIWSNRAAILNGLPNGTLKEWLSQKSRR